MTNTRLTQHQISFLLFSTILVFAILTSTQLRITFKTFLITRTYNFLFFLPETTRITTITWFKRLFALTSATTPFKASHTITFTFITIFFMNTWRVKLLTKFFLNYFLLFLGLNWSRDCLSYKRLYCTTRYMIFKR